MYATAKSLFVPLFKQDEAKAKTVAKAPAKALSPQQERIALIDELCSSWGTDRNALRRYLELSRIV